ncbi:MAG TPA: nodulation protein NfeD [Thermoanaerobacterales bacterium]|nr:nodulation protein NfeD [Thermoanaerobacterales bacterium]
MNKKLIPKFAIILVIIVSFLFTGVVFAESVQQDILEDKVYIIPVKGVIDPGLSNFIQRGIREAEGNKAHAIVFEINTPGGLIDASIQISESILDTKIPTIALVKNEAVSAGVLITISCDKVFMIYGSTIGAAEPRPKEEKIVSYWTSKLEGVAERKGRNKEIIAAMADADIEIPGVIEKGKLLSLTASQAKEHNIADELVDSRKEMLENMDLEDKNIIELTPSLAEKLAGLVTNPYISPLLLTIGFVGIITEILTLGFGLPGAVGIISLALYFGGHMLAGLAGFEALAFFLVGIVLLIIEAFIPGFGVFGILGISGIIASILAASTSIHQAIISIIVSFVGSIIILYLIFRYITKITFLDKIILTMKQEKDLGYKVSDQNLDAIVGHIGKTVTPLRPSGIIVVENMRLDAITEGEFVESNKKVKIIKTEGSKVVVSSEEE